MSKFEQNSNTPPKKPEAKKENKKIQLPETYQERDFRLLDERIKKEAQEKKNDASDAAKDKVKKMFGKNVDLESIKKGSANELLQKTLMKASGEIYLPDTEEADFLYGDNDKNDKKNKKKPDDNSDHPKIILPP